MPDNKGSKQSDNKGADMGSFFEELDKQVNGVVFENEVKPNNKGKAESKDSEAEGSKEVAALKKELDDLKKRYNASSSEAKRLHEKVEQLGKYEPLIEAMRKDPVLTSNVKGYLANDSVTTPIKERLGLDDDFIFDFDEAVGDPNSKSAKVMQQMVREQAMQVVGSALREEKAVSAEESRKRANEYALEEFQSKYKLESDEVKELLDWAQSRSLTYEDIYYLKNRGSRDSEIQRKMAEEREKQANRMSGRAASLGGVGNMGQNQESEEDVIWKEIHKAIEGSNIIDINR